MDSKLDSRRRLSRLYYPYDDRHSLVTRPSNDGDDSHPPPPPASTGAGGVRQQQHGSFIEPLQPVALHSPISPVRDYTYDGPPEEEEDMMMTSSPGLQHLPLRSPRDIEEWRDDSRFGGSNQPTPTTWDQRLEGDGMPDGLITDWDTEGVANWINSLGFGKYQDDLLG